MKKQPLTFEQAVLNSLARLEKRMSRVELRTAVLAATVAILVRYVF